MPGAALGVVPHFTYPALCAHVEVHEPEPSTEGSFSFRGYYPVLLCAVAESTESGTGLTKPLPLPIRGAVSK